MTNNEFYATIYKPYQEEHMTVRTSYTRCNIIENRLLEAYGNVTPNDISYLIIDKIYDDLEAQHYAQNTIFGTYAALYSYFRLSVKYRETEKNPVKYARTIRADIVEKEP